ncbi:hypothetical protein [Bosea sp. RAC05]|uniref:hypothetical protein n=1 Tax=Bosea sp. RAC05 TaxID=1842539 RepID=UPI00083DFF97|nr:hypothetical protein [Bosea sp. RAC05]AOG03257.1 hypothetical protein BSY19_5309 [Bosea sp. RAC05]
MSAQIKVNYDFTGKFILPKMRTANAKVMSRDLVIDIREVPALEAPGALHLRYDNQAYYQATQRFLDIRLDGHDGKLWKKVELPATGETGAVETTIIHHWSFPHGAKVYCAGPVDSGLRPLNMLADEFARANGIKAWVVDDEPAWREIARQDAANRFLMVGGELYKRVNAPILDVTLTGISGQIEFQAGPRMIYSDRGAVSFRFDQIEQARAYLRKAGVRGAFPETLRGLEIVNFDPAYGYFDQTNAAINSVLFDIMRLDGDFASLPLPALEAWIDIRRLGEKWTTDEYEPAPMIDAIIRFLDTVGQDAKVSTLIKKVSKAFLAIHDDLDRTPRLRPDTDAELVSLAGSF